MNARDKSPRIEDDPVSISGKFGTIHRSTLDILSNLSWRDARRKLRELGFTHAEQNALLALVKENIRR